MTDATFSSRVEMPSRLRLALRYIRRNKSLAIGLIILLALIAFTVIGQFVINPKHAYPLSAAARIRCEPSAGLGSTCSRPSLS